MKLHYSPASPYVRKVLVVAIETDLDSRIERIASDPWPAESAVSRENPLSKVPTLITEDGMTLFDSRVICEYLDSLHRRPRLFPAEGPARWQALRLQALGDGMLDAGVGRRVEQVRRPEAYQWEGWMQRQRSVMQRALDLLEREAATLQGPVTIGVIAVACALGYFDFRFAGDRWRDGRPKLASWYEGFATRPSMTATVSRDVA